MFAIQYKSKTKFITQVLDMAKMNKIYVSLSPYDCTFPLEITLLKVILKT